MVSIPLGLAGLLPWRLVLLGMTVLTLAYLVLADWLYMARLAGYVCIAEMPEAVLVAGTAPPPVPPAIDSFLVQSAPVDRDELILSDTSNSISE